jgi:hypothetical protein
MIIKKKSREVLYISFLVVFHSYNSNGTMRKRPLIAMHKKEGLNAKDFILQY